VFATSEIPFECRARVFGRNLVEPAFKVGGPNETPTIDANGFQSSLRIRIVHRRPNDLLISVIRAPRQTRPPFALLVP
jgi:hypothetical protein